MEFGTGMELYDGKDSFILFFLSKQFAIYMEDAKI